jgi:hypothetical protein
MELTPERKQQIEEEERRRVAEERYRAQVRTNLNVPPSPTLPPPLPHAQEPVSRKAPVWLWVLGILAVVVAGVVILMKNMDTSTLRPTSPTAATGARAPGRRYVPVSQKIASGQIGVRAKDYMQYQFQITPDMRNAHISGHFSASGGSGNDIEVVIATEDEFANWINGHQARVFYSTQGRKTTDTFDVHLAPGMYYLAFNNRFSAITAKNVLLDVDLDSEKMETY